MKKDFEIICAKSISVSYDYLYFYYPAYKNCIKHLMTSGPGPKVLLSLYCQRSITTFCCFEFEWQTS